MSGRRAKLLRRFVRRYVNPEENPAAYKMFYRITKREWTAKSAPEKHYLGRAVNAS